MSTRRIPKDYKKVEAAVKAAPGWEIQTGGKGHFKVMTPQGRIAVSIPCSGSDSRNLKNDISQLRRYGLGI
jgi:hypothetical protein